MSESCSDDRVSPLLERLTTLEELRRNAKVAKEEAEARIARIKSETRVKDRHRWLALWANGDLSVCDEYRSRCDEVKHREQQSAQLSQTQQSVLGQLDQVIADNFEQVNPDYRGIVIEQREIRRKRDVCRDALAVVLMTRGNIMSVSASLRVEPKGRTAVAAAKKKPDEISAQLSAARKKVGEVNKIVGSRDLVNGRLVSKLDITFLGTEFGPDKRKRQLDETARTLDDVARKIETSRRTFEKRLKDLEKDRTHMVRVERDHLLSMHGLM
jgi:hypothetical protein